MSVRGSFCLVLHSHIPYVRKAGRWPFGEEWVHEAMLETYLPLAMLLDRWERDKLNASITLGLTPVLLEQLADGHMRENFQAYLDDKIRRAKEDVGRFRKRREPPFEKSAADALAHFERLRVFLREGCRGGLLAALRRFQDAGLVEIMTSPASHAYLPLLSRDSSIQGQLLAGLHVTQKYFGRRAQGMWLPECAYRPALTVSVTRNESYSRPPLDDFLASLGMRYFLVDTQAIEGGEAGWGGMTHGLYNAEDTSLHGGDLEPTQRSVFRPYLTRAGVAVLGRHRRAGLQVWSGEVGYPADGDYREFHKRDDQSGLQYWRITSKDTPLGSKKVYDPAAALAKAEIHAAHFAGLVEKLCADHFVESEERGVLVASYDTELFGHWWHEGMVWLDRTVRLLARNQAVEVTNLSAYLDQAPAVEVVDLPESSWGRGGKHEVWQNEKVNWMWDDIHAAELAMEELLNAHPSPTEAEERLLRQAARELMLMQSSDWPFLVTTHQAEEYAAERFKSHAERFERLAGFLKDGRAPHAAALKYLSEVEALDNCFADVDPRWFARRQPQPVTEDV